MFISRVYRPDGQQWPWYTLLLLELPITIALLALFGIADPDLYRTKLWQDGADNGFNSSPIDGLYAAANYRPYKTPLVWSQFVTNFNLVISVLSMFIMLTKAVMFIVHVWPPLLSAVVHAGLTVVYALSAAYQAGSDTSDPKHPQHGAPWYITKSCSVAHTRSNVHYCQQAKAAFACTVVAAALFFLQTVYSLASAFFPSRATKAMHISKKDRHSSEKSRLSSKGKSVYSEAESLDPAPSTAHRSLFSPMGGLHTPGTTGGMKSPGFQSPTFAANAPESMRAPTNSRLEQLRKEAGGALGIQPMTPRTQAFNRLGGTKDLPLRNHFSSPIPPALKSPTFGLMSPRGGGFPREVRDEDDDTSDIEKAGAANGNVAPGTATSTPMYFPPPPKMSGGKK